MVFGTFELGGIVFIFGQLFALAVSCALIHKINKDVRARKLHGDHSV
ncbi:hypothetical protein [Ferrovum sp.]|nr:hypothetical protein [Ferrovum sp.]